MTELYIYNSVDHCKYLYFDFPQIYWLLLYYYIFVKVLFAKTPILGKTFVIFGEFLCLSHSMRYEFTGSPALARIEHVIDSSTPFTCVIDSSVHSFVLLLSMGNIL